MKRGKYLVVALVILGFALGVENWNAQAQTSLSEQQTKELFNRIDKNHFSFDSSQVSLWAAYL